jgi:heat-inducible transcriptional repressor
MEPRKQEILKAVVHEFTSSAVPVGSQALVSRHFLNLSSATIRSELSDLVDLGYLVQPHTSAGRIPTDRGYRYFVDFLMDTQPVPPEVESFIDGELRTVPADPLALVERVATTTAAVTQNAAVVSSPHGPQARLKHVDLVSLEPSEVLLILLVEGNLLRQQVVTVSQPAGQAELSRLANKINRELGGKDRDALGLRLRRLGEGLERELLTRLTEALELFERGAETLVVHDGVRNLLKQPEFAEPSRLQQVLEVLEETRYLAALLQELVGASDLQIVIGSENQTSQLRSCAVVLTTYGPSRRMKGVLGVVGPTRMDYGQTVGRLQSVAQRASDRMSEVWA